MRPWNDPNKLFGQPNQFGAVTVDDLEGFNYESPIKAIETKMQFEFEGELMRAVKSLGFDVDKDELLRALQYDREQYAKGYLAGRAKDMAFVTAVDMEQMSATEILNYYRNLYYTESMTTERRIVAEAINEVLPTVVRHGQWDTVFYEGNGTLSTYSHICPNCKYFYRDLRFKGHNHCPNCGMKMDGGTKNETD